MATRLKGLIKKADMWMSRYVRVRELDKDGLISCATCGKRLPPDQMDNGHYLPRQHKAVRWEEKNTAPQCSLCNDYEGGEQDLMGKYLDKKYGVGTSAWLQGFKHVIYKSYPSVISEIAETYKNKCLQLLAEKCYNQWWK